MKWLHAVYTDQDIDGPQDDHLLLPTQIYIFQEMDP